jgi:hypothetical protein
MKYSAVLEISKYVAERINIIFLLSMLKIKLRISPKFYIL